ncbi:MAG: sulfatase [Candidatus Hermodarchaeota archaeon]
MNKKPNVILFITHDQGQFLGCYNSPQTPNALNTPNLDKLAENGVRFTNLFCTAPQCSPSRGAIQTSLYPHQNGLMGLVDRGWTLPERNKTLPMYLKEQGYTTHLLGFQHEAFDAHTLGYDTISKRRPEPLYNCKKLKKNYEEFLENHKNDEKPFYLCIGDIQVHRPFGIWGDPVNPDSVLIPPYLPDNEIVRKDLAQFYGAIQVVDNCIGNIIKKLAEFDLREITLFIYTTDHGEAYPRAKCTLYDPGLKTLLLMSWIGSNIFRKNRVYNQLISNIDLLPTLLDIIGAVLPENIAGRSFLPLLKGETDKFRENIFSEKTFHEYYDPMRSIRTEDYKFIINFEESENLYQLGMDLQQDELGKYMLKLINKPRANEELYDLKNDPNEIHNLIDNYSYKDIARELKDKLYEWMRQTNDPILKGRIKDLRQKPPLRF